MQGVIKNSLHFFSIIFMKKKVFKLIKYLSKYGQISKSFAANYFIKICETYNIFNLPDEKQIILIDNLINYFESLVISFDKVGVINKTNKHITPKEILNHFQRKTKEFAEIESRLKLY